MRTDDRDGLRHCILDLRDIRSPSRNKLPRELTEEDLGQETLEAIDATPFHFIYLEIYGRTVKVFRDHYAGTDRAMEEVGENLHDLRKEKLCVGSMMLSRKLPEPIMVVAVAMQFADGLMITAPRPARHHHLVTSWVFQFGHMMKYPHGVEQGFLLSDGSFANRELAYEVALGNGQIRKGETPCPGMLFSEDVWKQENLGIDHDATDPRHEEERQRVLRIAEERGEFYKGVDGFEYFWPDRGLYGHMEAHHLRWIADELERRNAPWEKEVGEMLDKADSRRIPDDIQPPLDCSREDLLAFFGTLEEGDRVIECGESGMKGQTGTIVLSKDPAHGKCVRWDTEFEEGTGMVSGITGGTRRLPAAAENKTEQRP